MTFNVSEVLPESPAIVAERVFQASEQYALRHLKCNFCDGVLTIWGRVPSYYLKQCAQSLVQELDGVQRVSNLTEVAAN